jgi:carboxymethylenebutenolidase
MSAEPVLTSDVIGLTKVAPFSRRGFMTASAAVTAGYTLAAGPVRADVIKTDTDGLTAGLFRAAEGREQSAGRAGRN